MHGWYTFSSFSVTGSGLSAVTAAAMAAAASNALAFEYPGKCTNRESVSPYTTRAPRHRASPECTVRIARSSVSRPHCTMASASSAMGMRPEKPAAVYPYVTFAMSFKPNCFAFRARRRALASAGACFRHDFTIARVSRISASKRGKIPGRTFFGANITPLGVTVTPGGFSERGAGSGSPSASDGRLAPFLCDARSIAGNRPGGKASSWHPSLRGGPPPRPATWSALRPVSDAFSFSSPVSSNIASRSLWSGTFPRHVL
mmetsp:Transcript_4181/g.17750  ORF Transcript_4181/g.17750 Transcript_4181/m.17750 type:complete len:259 (-) Transcript_4181:218-994(-)